MGHEILSSSGYDEDAYHEQIMQFLGKIDRVFDRRNSTFSGGDASAGAVTEPSEGLVVAVKMERGTTTDGAKRYLVGVSSVMASNDTTWDAAGLEWAKTQDENAATLVPDSLDGSHEEQDLSEFAPDFQLSKDMDMCFVLRDAEVFASKTVDINLYNKHRGLIEQREVVYEDAGIFCRSFGAASNMDEPLDKKEAAAGVISGLEDSLYTVTAADLIVSCSFLRGVGILNPRTIAFSGAPLELSGFDYSSVCNDSLRTLE